MKMDPTTESIAHFIGLFQLAVEELRLRQDYIEFQLKRTAEEATPPIEVVGVRLQAPYELGRYDPGLVYEPQAPELPPVGRMGMNVRSEPDVPAPPRWEPDPPDEPSFIRSVDIPPFSFPLLPPGSVVSVTIQVVRLSDNDLFLNGLGVEFIDPEVLEAALDGIVALAEALVGFQMPDLPDDSDWIGFAESMLAQIAGASPPDGAAEVSTFRGEDASGTFVDGAMVDEAPVWTDLLPHYLQPEELPTDEAEEGASLDAVTDGETVAHSSDGPGQGGSGRTLNEHDFSRDFGEDTPNPFALEPGHEIVAGANKAINEIALGSQWIDAPVIVVRGDAARFDAVSQVNVLVEHDTIDGAAAYQDSAAYNVAEIITESSRTDDALPPEDILPSGWQVVRVEADLLQVNWVKQFTYATDFDRAEVTFSAQASFLGLGENQILNSTILNEIGYNFDVIFVAGDMVDATVVSQKNVLFDTDAVTTGDPAAAPAAAIPEAGETALAVRAEDLGTAAERVPSDEVDTSEEWPGETTVTSQEADATSADAAGWEASTGPRGQAFEEAGLAERGPDGSALETEEEPETPEPESQPALSLADNLLFNKATIETTGVDKFVEMTEAFAAAAESLAEGAETISREVAQDALFAGTEALRVLQIDGDLTKLNLFEQTNIVGDADQIRLEMEALRDQFEAEMKLIAGSNALVNLATVTEYGVDSTIMAGGKVYDDAFIHQAELFDTDAVPNGVAVSALTKEAIAAFLSDDMLKATEVTDEIVPTGNHEASSQLDVMQTALT